MDYITILGFVAATCTTVAFLPQVMKTWQSKSAKDVSFGMLVFFCSGIFLWFIYGVFIKSSPVIIANLLTLILNLIILYLKIKYE
ncbi:MAG TPA: SemiSWEET transporter [Oscillatoriaceae cyanobacterium M33_DOE_052]|uniref:MtN3 and saliva related transmembrane protein n=1 Tax=Planktothricoides sp. SpSt-374 TaxID=2282167 RepID=A0A7C3ZKQ1_9CYAN|nr:SemiSWEET transporter [Oscillatoriaceae cyanobacterium M33_DOE_052]